MASVSSGTSSERDDVRVAHRIEEVMQLAARFLDHGAHSGDPVLRMCGQRLEGGGGIAGFDEIEQVNAKSSLPR